MKEDIRRIIAAGKKRLPDILVEELPPTDPSDCDPLRWRFSLPGVEAFVDIADSSCHHAAPEQIVSFLTLDRSS